MTNRDEQVDHYRMSVPDFSAWSVFPVHAPDLGAVGKSLACSTCARLAGCLCRLCRACRDKPVETRCKIKPAPPIRQPAKHNLPLPPQTIRWGTACRTPTAIGIAVSYPDPISEKIDTYSP